MLSSGTVSVEGDVRGWWDFFRRPPRPYSASVRPLDFRRRGGRFALAAGGGFLLMLLALLALPGEVLGQVTTRPFWSLEVGTISRSVSFEPVVSEAPDPADDPMNEIIENESSSFVGIRVGTLGRLYGWGRLASAGNAEEVFVEGGLHYPYILDIRRISRLYGGVVLGYQGYSYEGQNAPNSVDLSGISGGVSVGFLYRFNRRRTVDFNLIQRFLNGTEAQTDTHTIEISQSTAFSIGLNFPL